QSVRSCCQILRSEIDTAPGIESLQLDPEEARLVVRYDGRAVSEEQLAALTERLRPALELNLAGCPVLHGRDKGDWCDSCVRIAEEECSSFDVRAGAVHGLISITPERQANGGPTAAEATDELAIDLAVPSTQAPGPAGIGARLHSFWRRATNLPWEAILTAATLVLMFTALAVEHFADAQTLTTLLYVAAYITGGIFGVRGGIESLKELTIDVDLLMVLAALGAAIVGAPFEGVLLLFLFSLSNVLQEYAMGRTRNAIRALMQLRPARASVLRGGEEVILPVESCRVGDIFVARPGESIALDGLVVDGASAVDQAIITGESAPVGKGIGDSVLAGTINKNGLLKVQVTKAAKDSTLAKVIKLVEEAQGQKAKTQRFLDTAEQYYAMGVIAATALAVIIPVFLLGEGFDGAFYRAMTLMVAASPCAIVISTPASILSGIGNGARRGILFKGGIYLEQAAEIKVVALDKTGTLTAGKPEVSDVVLMPGAEETLTALGAAAVAGSGSGTDGGPAGIPAEGPPGEEQLLALVAAVEGASEHILAKATVEEARRRRLAVSEAIAFESVSGRGVRARVDGRTILIGNRKFISGSEVANLDDALPPFEALERQNKTVVLVAEETGPGNPAPGVTVLGLVAFSDRLRDGAADVVRDLRETGVPRIVMITGDNAETANRIGREVGVDEVYSELLPDEKLSVIEELEAKYGPVAMVGDGVNDAPALARASIGIAMGAAGTDVALETADIVLMADDLSKVAYVVDLSRRTRKTLVFNLGLAGLLIAIMILGIFTVQLPLPLAVVGHEGGTVLVSLNGLRLLFFKRPGRGPMKKVR
ncbi:MAG: HAD-IC family P-type ATPase, partial [Spirochaetaceae bacterium]